MAAEQAPVTITIDGVDVLVPAGTLIIRAAEKIGKYIPRFCDHPLLDPLGACRQCLVEVEGQRKPLTACTTPVAEGMVVKTEFTSDLARDGQKGVLEFLLINHPLDCPMCDKGGECPLQDQALAYGPGGSRYIDPKRRFTKPVPISPLVKLDRERCVLCARCTRFSDQIAGDPFIELFERGALEQVAIFEDEPYDSIFSGNVIQICPVGALTSSTFRFRARPFDMTSADSTCNRCASGCRITAQMRRGELVRVLAKGDRAVNDEWMCDKGRFAYPYVRSPERVVEPMVRKNGDFVAVSWAEAIEVVAGQITAAREAGKTSAVLAGRQLLDEDAYAVSRFARTVLGTNDVDARRSVGGEDEDGVIAAIPRTITATNQDIDTAKLIVTIGVDLHEESPIVFLRVRKAARRGTPVREIGPRRSGEIPGALWTACRPAREAALLAGVARALEARGNSGIDPSTRAVMQGVDPTAEAQELASALQGVHGSVVVLAGERLAQTPGALGLAWNITAAVGGKFGWIPRKAGARGAAWAGLHPATLPGGRSVEREEDRAAFGEVWGIDPPSKRGRDARTILRASAGLGVLFLVGADPATDFDDRELAAGAIDDAPFVVALDLFLTESSRRADVVLPAAAAYERDGTLSNWEGRPQPVRAAVPPAGLAQSDFEILSQIAAESGVQFPETIEALRKEMKALRVDPAAARAVPVGHMDVPPAGALLLSTYRPLLGDGTMMQGADALEQTAPPLVVEMNPDDARGLSSGELVVARAVSGEVRAPLVLTDAVARGVVFVQAHAGFAGRNGETVTVEKADA